MRVGISVNTVTKLDGEQEKMDGIGTYTNQLMKAFKERIEIKNVLFKSPRQTIKHPGSYENKNLFVSPSPIISQFLPINSYKNISSKIDLFHSTDYLVPKIKNIPVIATLHDAIMIKNHYWAGGKYRKLKNFILKSLASNANHVITISHAIKNDIKEFWNIPEDKVSVVYHGMSEFWFKTYHAEVKKAILEFFNIQKPFYLIVGTLQPRKNIARIMAAYQALPASMQQEFILVFVGNRGWLDNETFGDMMKLQSSGHLKWLQYVNLLELQCLYQSAHLSLFPSLSEGFGFPILEGFASKTPVITSNFGATEEIAGNAAYLVNAESVEQISEAMKDLSFDEELRNHYIQAGYTRVKEFTWEDCVQNTLSVYTNVLKNTKV